MWKSGCSVASVDAADRFNGAATLSLRKCSMRICSCRAGVTLQWGRNFIVAEMDAVPVCLVISCLLQWGRNFIVAEIGHNRHCHAGRVPASMGPQLYRCGNEVVQCGGVGAVAMLQWGRNFIVAEILTSEGSKFPPYFCFNGAATLSLRKCGMFGNFVPGGWALQWGRNFIVAEIMHSHSCLERPH